MAPLQNRMRPDPITAGQGAINGVPTKTVCAPESDNRVGQGAGAAAGGAFMRPGSLSGVV